MQYSDCITSFHSLTDKQRIGKEAQGSCIGVIGVTLSTFNGGLKEVRNAFC